MGIMKMILSRFFGRQAAMIDVWLVCGSEPCYFWSCVSSCCLSSLDTYNPVCLLSGTGPLPAATAGYGIIINPFIHAQSSSSS